MFLSLLSYIQNCNSEKLVLKLVCGLGVVAYARKPKVTQQVETGRTTVRGQPGQKVSKTSSQSTILVWWHMPMISFMWEE
jgi:hypothetical protein